MNSLKIISNTNSTTHCNRCSLEGKEVVATDIVIQNSATIGTCRDHVSISIDIIKDINNPIIIAENEYYQGEYDYDGIHSKHFRGEGQ